MATIHPDVPLPTFILPYEKWSTFIQGASQAAAITTQPTVSYSQTDTQASHKRNISSVPLYLSITPTSSANIFVSTERPVLLRSITSSNVSPPQKALVSMAPTLTLPTDLARGTADWRYAAEKYVSSGIEAPPNQFALSTISLSYVPVPTIWDPLVHDITTTSENLQVETASMKATPRENTSMSPVTIIGLATGGLVAALVSLTLLILFCWRQRRREPKHDSPKESILKRDQEEKKANISLCTNMSSKPLHKTPISSLRSEAFASVGSTGKTIRWQDEINAQNFSLPPPPNPSDHPIFKSQERILQDTTSRLPPVTKKTAKFSGIPPKPSFAKDLNRNFSAPLLNTRSQSYSVQDSVYINTACAPPRSGATKTNEFRSNRFAASYYGSMYSGSGRRTTVDTDICSLSLHDTHRSLSDSFTVQPNRKSSIRNSGTVISRHASYIEGPATPTQPSSVVFQSNSKWTSVENVPQSPGNSTTSSSILNYSVEGVSSEYDVMELAQLDQSSPISSLLGSPPSGGLSSPCYQRPSAAGWGSSRYPLGDLGPLTPTPIIGIALTPPVVGSVSETPALLSVRKFRNSRDLDLFLADEDYDNGSHSSAHETRHFSCGLPTRPRLFQLDCSSDDSPRSVYDPSAAFNSSPPDSPTLPWAVNCSGSNTPDTELSDPFECEARTKSPYSSFAEGRYSRNRVGSTYSPTLSILNYYNSPYSSEEDVRAKSTTPSPNLHYSKSFTGALFPETSNSSNKDHILLKVQVSRPLSAEYIRRNLTKFTSPITPLNWALQELRI